MAQRSILEPDAIETAFTKMPELHGKAKELYIKYYGKETYDAYTDVVLNTFHGERYIPDTPDDTKFSHRPDHDMESMFWILVFTLLLAKPLGAPDEATPAFQAGYKLFHNHVISDDPFDQRERFLLSGKKRWQQSLHPKLSSLAGLLWRMADQVKPEYGLLESLPVQDHLHEAFRRLLLEHIISMDDPIPLTPYISRDPQKEENGGNQDGVEVLASKPNQAKAGSKKRKGPEHEDDERPSKTARSGGVFSGSLEDVRYMND